MFEALRHLSFELTAGVLALTLIGAGLALLAAPQSWLISSIPVIGGFVASIRTSAATVLIAAGVGVGSFVGGYAHRGTLDKSAALQAQLDAAREDLANTKLVAQAANEREQMAELSHDADKEEVRKYAEDVAKKGDDLALAGAELERLRGLIDAHSKRTAAASRTVRSARAASIGCKVTLANYIAALNEANRRLVNDAAFYRDVQEKFSAKPGE